MESGLLYLETSPTHSGLVRIRFLADPLHEISGTEIDPDDDAQQRLVLRFHDIEAAAMHAHQCMRRYLVDVDTHTYRIPLPEAIACLQAIELRHQTVFIDPDLPERDVQSIETQVAALHRRAKTVDRIWQIVGGLAIAFLVLLATTL